MHNLDVITGFASSSFIYHVIHNFPKLHLNVTIGMAKIDGVKKWDHLEYIRIAKQTRRLQVKYFNGHPPIHAKGIIWYNGISKIAFAGSSNFSWNGFRDYQELMTEVDPIALESVFPIDNLIDLNDPIVNDIGMIVDTVDMNQPKNLKELSQTKKQISLPLFSEKTGDIQKSSGLNWGQRPEYRREPNQAYIPVPQIIHEKNSDFFPKRGEEFTIITDDGDSFICVLAQDNAKAIETRYDNSILGKYFRKRLNVPLGDFVKLEDLKKYGRTSIVISKMSDDLYFMDFSN
jgi:hypothetical protein